MCFNPSPERRVPSPNRYMAFARFCFCKNNKRTIDRTHTASHTHCSLARLPPTHPFVGAPILQLHFQVQWRFRLPPPCVLLPRCSGCLLLNVKGTFIGMSESRRGLINGTETATSVPCDPRKTRRTIRPAANIHTESRRSKCAEESEDPGLQ